MSELIQKDFRYPSADGVHTVSGKLYTVKGVTPHAVVQLSHGMCEYIGRYAALAQVLAAQGYAVAGNDHLGHGDTATSGEYGTFAEKNGRNFVLEDLHTANTWLHGQFAGLPVILYGHSMGSFFARWYAEKYPETIDGLIISGTGGPSVANEAGKLLATVIAAAHKKGYVSPLMKKLNFGSYCNKIEAPASANAWLTRDEEAVKRYDEDPLCGFSFTAEAYREMLCVLTHVSKKKWAQAINKAMPVLIISGGDDPVGNYGEGVRAVWAMLGDAGVQDLTCQIWEKARHEMHNETNKEEVYEYLLGWLNQRWGPKAAGE